MVTRSVATLRRLVLRRLHHAALLTAIAIAALCVSAASERRFLVAAEEGTLEDVPYSAPVLRVLEEARQEVASGRVSEALRKLHEVLEFATPALTIDKLELHRQVARAFVELGYPDHAVRTLEAALQDARVAGQEDIARAIESDLRSLGFEATPSGGEQQAGWLSRFLRPQHTAQHDRPVRPPVHHPAHSSLAVPMVTPPSGSAQNTQPETAVPVPAAPLVGPEGFHPNHGYLAQPNPAPPLDHAPHAHGQAAHRISLFQRIRHWWHRWMPQARARTSHLAPRPVPPPALPQYPVAGCENCRKRGLNPSLAHPPAPPLGTIPPIAGSRRGVPLSPYSAHSHPHQMSPQVRAPIVRPRRPGFLQRIGGLLSRPFAAFRRRDARPVPQVPPGWPPVEPQLGGALNPEAYPR